MDIRVCISIYRWKIIQLPMRFYLVKICVSYMSIKCKRKTHTNQLICVKVKENFIPGAYIVTFTRRNSMTLTL